MVHHLPKQLYQSQNHHDLQACSQPTLIHYNLKSLSIWLQIQSLPLQVLRMRINKVFSASYNYLDQKLQTDLGTTLESIYKNRSPLLSVNFLTTNCFLSNNPQWSVIFAKIRYRPDNNNRTMSTF